MGVAYCQGLWRYREKTVSAGRSEGDRFRRGSSERTGLDLRNNIGLPKSAIVSLSPRDFWTTVVEPALVGPAIVVCISGDLIRDRVRDEAGEMALPLYSHT